MPVTDAYGLKVLADGATAFWRLEEASGTSLADATGNGHTATLGATTGVTYQVASPTAGFYGLAFDGLTQLPATITAIAGTPPISIECWVRPEQLLQLDLFLFGTILGNDTGLFSIEQFQNLPFSVFSVLAGNQTLSQKQLADGQLYHLVITVDGNDLGTLYVNAVPEVTFSGYTANADNFTRLFSDDTHDRIHVSFIDEIALYSGVALTFIQVFTHYQLYLNRQPLSDQRVMEEMQYAAVETPDLGVTWASGLWTATEVLNYLTQRQNRFLKETGIFVSQGRINVQAGTTRVALVDQGVALPYIEAIDASWQYQNQDPDSPAQVRHHPLERVSPLEMDLARRTWTTVTGLPIAFITTEVVLELQLAPAPDYDGILHLEYFGLGAELTGTGELFTVPDIFLPAVKWGALADMLSKAGRGQNIQKAAYAESRYQEGLAMALSLLEEEVL